MSSHTLGRLVRQADARSAHLRDVSRPALDFNSFTPVRMLADCVGRQKSCNINAASRTCAAYVLPLPRILAGWTAIPQLQSAWLRTYV